MFEVMIANKKSSPAQHFLKITNNKALNEIINILSECHITIEGMNLKKQRFSFKSLRFQESQLFVEIIDSSEPQKPSKWVFSFQVLKNQYFITTQLVPNKNKELYIDFQADLYQLQRRESYRVDLPSDMPLCLNITEINDKSLSLHYSIKDLSTGGVGFLIPNKHKDLFQKENLLKGYLSQNSNSIGSFEAKIRNTRSINNDYFIGLQFSQLNASINHRLQAFIMEIYRQNIVTKRGSFL